MKCDRCSNEVGEYITDAPKIDIDIKKVCYPCYETLINIIINKNKKAN
jgi:hypothetical protein